MAIINSSPNQCPIGHLAISRVCVGLEGKYRRDLNKTEMILPDNLWLLEMSRISAFLKKTSYIHKINENRANLNPCLHSV